MSLSLTDLVKLFSQSAPPEAHTVFVNGREAGTCRRASFRSVLSLRGLEFVLDYAYELDGKVTSYSTRARQSSLGRGGRERILVNGQDVEGDDVILSGSQEGLAVEFRYLGEGKEQVVKFVAPLDAFRD